MQDINADLMFVGADGIDAVNGITTFNEGYSISGAMVTAANKVIAVLDSSKFNRGVDQVLPIEKIDIIITDDAVSEVDKLALQKTRVKLIALSYCSVCRIRYLHRIRHYGFSLVENSLINAIMDNPVVIDNATPPEVFQYESFVRSTVGTRLKVISCGACISNHDEAPLIILGYLRQILRLIREPEDSSPVKFAVAASHNFN